MAVTKLSADNYAEAISNAKGVAIVKFFAPWCGHCRMFAPVFEEASEVCADIASFFEINVDDNKDFAKSLGLESIPTLIWNVDGAQKELAIGMIPVDDIKAKIESFK